MRSGISGLAAIAALCVGASVGVAQQRDYQLEAGARVRLTSPKLPARDRIVRIVAAGGDTISFRSERDSMVRTLPLTDIDAVEVSLGQRRQVARGAGLGVLVGGALGGVVGYATYTPCEGFCILGPSSRGESAVFGALGGGVLGLVVGTTIGVVRKTEKWQRVQSTTRVGLVPTRGGGAVSFSHAF